MSTRTARKTSNQRIESVRIYTDLDAFKSPDFSQGWALKACHNDLYQTALDRFPVTHVALIQGYQMSADGLPHTVAQDHPLWWPGTRTDKNPDRLILVPLESLRPKLAHLPDRGRKSSDANHANHSGYRTQRCSRNKQTRIITFVECAAWATRDTSTTLPTRTKTNGDRPSNAMTSTSLEREKARTER